ncbi:MAG TPA: acyltransferase domain-containing protein [Thermomicrobiales bacterium]|nr:acyltransferase domain-containing protein [Thermomicrobiales bacterium]
MARSTPLGHSVEQIRDFLSQDESSRAWLDHLDEIGPSPVPITLPSSDHAALDFLDLSVPHDDIDTLIWFLPDPGRTPGVWWLLDRAAHSVSRTVGQVPPPPWFPALPRELGEFRRYFYFYVLLAVRPLTLEYHRKLGIPPDISRHTLTDLGRKFTVHRKNHGTGGIDTPAWLTHHLRGQLYQLGRLQFERVHAWDKLRDGMRAAGCCLAEDEVLLSVHITDFSGPLSPAACDASFDRARSFFAQVFPETPARYAICSSWMLDPQLAEYLKPSANVIQFQNRFTPAYRPDPGNRGILQFVFGMLDAEIDDLPQTTSLERAVVGHLKAGRSWRGGVGWLML